jgi:hypothetical protein
MDVECENLVDGSEWLDFTTGVIWICQDGMWKSKGYILNGVFTPKSSLFKKLQQESNNLSIFSNGVMPRYVKMDVLERFEYSHLFTFHEIFCMT